MLGCPQYASRTSGALVSKQLAPWLILPMRVVASALATCPFRVLLYDNGVCDTICGDEQSWLLAAWKLNSILN